MNYNKYFCTLLDNHDNMTHDCLKLIHNKQKYINIISYLLSYYTDSLSIKETLYRIKHNITNKPVCKTCGNKLKFQKQILKSTNDYFGIYCSPSCQMKDNEQYKLRNFDINKTFNTNLLRYGDKHYSNITKRNITNINRYGSICPLLNDKVKEKTKNTNIKKYGCEIPQQNSFVKERISIGQKKSAEKKTIIQKQLSTNKANKTKFYKGKITKDEKIIYKYLISKYGEHDVIFQHYDKIRYPFNCDFYIKSQDLFIEVQANKFIHGTHPYNKLSLEDQKILNEKYIIPMKDKLKRTGYAKGYEDAINTWTKMDPLKRQFAKDNNLNYIEIWNVNNFTL